MFPMTMTAETYGHVRVVDRSRVEIRARTQGEVRCCHSSQGLCASIAAFAKRMFQMMTYFFVMLGRYITCRKITPSRSSAPSAGIDASSPVPMRVESATRGARETPATVSPAVQRAPGPSLAQRPSAPSSAPQAQAGSNLEPPVLSPALGARASLRELCPNRREVFVNPANLSGEALRQLENLIIFYVRFDVQLRGLPATDRERIRVVGEKRRISGRIEEVLAEAGLQLVRQGEGSDEPVRFLDSVLRERIDAGALEIYNQHSDGARRELVARYTGAVITDANLDALHREAEIVRARVDSLNYALARFVTNAQLPEAVAREHQIVVEVDRGVCTLQGSDRSNAAMGYVLFSMFVEAGIIVPQSDLDRGGRQYDGESSYRLDLDAMRRLTVWLEGLEDRYLQLAYALSGLVGRSVAEARTLLKTGQKAASELAGSMLPSTQRGREVWAAFVRGGAHRSCLIPGTICLDVTSHDGRDIVKAALEAIYRACGMRAVMSNGQAVPKQFESDTYLTNISSEEFSQMQKWLSRVACFVRDFTSFFGTDNLAVACLQLDALREDVNDNANTPQAILERKLADEIWGVLREMAAPAHVEADIRRHIRAQEAPISREDTGDQFVELFHQFEGVYRRFDQALGWALGHWLRVSFRGPHTRIRTFALTDQQRRLLYGRVDPPFKAYGQTRNVFYNLENLFRTLTTSPVFQRLVRDPDTIQGVDAFRRLFERYLAEQYDIAHEVDPRQGHGVYYGKHLIRSAVRELEDFVGRIVDQQASGVDDGSIVAAMQSMVALVTGAGNASDTIQGCNLGMIGRVLSFCNVLRRHDESLEGYLTHRVRETLETVYMAHPGQQRGESSSMPRYFADAQRFLGIQDHDNGSARMTWGQLSRTSQEIIQGMLLRFGSAAVYEHACTFVQDQLRAKLAEPDSAELRAEIAALLLAYGFGRNQEEIEGKYCADGSRENPFELTLLVSDIPRVVLRYLVEQQLLVLGDGTRTTGTCAVEGEAGIYPAG